MQGVGAFGVTSIGAEATCLDLLLLKVEGSACSCPRPCIVSNVSPHVFWSCALSLSRRLVVWSSMSLGRLRQVAAEANTSKLECGTGTATLLVSPGNLDECTAGDHVLFCLLRSSGTNVRAGAGILCWSLSTRAAPHSLAAPAAPHDVAVSIHGAWLGSHHVQPHLCFAAWLAQAHCDKNGSS